MSDDKNAWQAYYSIMRKDDEHEDGDLGFSYATHFYIIDKSSNEVLHGPYRDYTYAKKQARRKYKKLVRNMERALMS